MVAEEKNWCGCWDAKKGFPTFAVIVLVLAVLWILGDIGILTVNVPWFPVILAIIAIGWIIDSLRKK